MEFWTYSCINWRRSLPYVRAWSMRYRPQGLVVIGVHSPEFGFEREIANVRAAARAMGIDFPIAIDNDYAIWRAFENEFWPALYFADEKGRIRHHQFGEGGYDKAETVIQSLLGDAGKRNIASGALQIDASGAELGADWADLKSQENYVGYERTVNFASPGGLEKKSPHTYSPPSTLHLNHWALKGEWIAGKQSILLHAANGCIIYQFHARDLHLVMGLGSSQQSIRFRVILNGEAPAAAHGTDLDANGEGVVVEPRMYHLIRQQRVVADCRFEIEFLSPGAEVYSFTFG